jgi:16S rRNA G527 N7-methylase RsmG
LQENSFKEFTIDSVLEKFGGRDRFSGYVEFLLEENSRVNLVSRETTPEDLYGLVADCLIPVYMEGPKELFPERNWTKVLDIGSGGGLPSIPLALALGNVELTLIERTGKKAMFLRRALQKFCVKGKVLNCNFREFADNPGIQTVTGELSLGADAVSSKPTFDIVTIRWVKADSAMIRKAANFLNPGSETSGLIYYSDPQEIVSKTLQLSPYAYQLNSEAEIQTDPSNEDFDSKNSTVSIFKHKR